MRMTMMKHYGVAFLMVLALSSHSKSMTVLPMNLDQMAQDSGKIIHGRVVAVREEIHETLRIPVSIISLQTEECLKGDATGQVQFRQVKGMGLPVYRQGDEIVIFLYPESKVGVTSPVGGDQGLFKVMATKEGKKIKNLYPHLFEKETLKPRSRGNLARTVQLDFLKSRIRAATFSGPRSLR
jgi:hypothetical protein